MNKLFLVTILVAGMATSLSSCKNKDKSGRVMDTPTKGELTIAVDESLKPLAESELNIFHSIYKYAKITPLYVSETEAYNLLMKDSVQFVLGTRKLTEAEHDYWKKRQHKVYETPIATDAVTLILNRENKDSTFSTAQLEKLFTGKAPQWSDLFSSSKVGKLSVVFDQPGSSTLRAITSHYNMNALPAYFSAVNGNAEVIEYVKTHKNAIGVIGRAWISDTQDSNQLAFLKVVRVAQLEVPDSAKAKADRQYFGPYAAALYLGAYPYPRPIYAITHESYKGLALGLRNFMALDGQNVALLMGLLPAAQPGRNIRIR